MKLFYLFSIFFLLGCMSSEKQRYDSLLKDQNPSLNNSGKSSREIAYWKNASQFNENNFQFVTKQMKEVIKNYSKMKKQLVKIESKLDNLLNQMALAIEEYSSRENDDMKDSEDDEEEEDDELSTEENTENNAIDSKDSVIYQEDITDDKNIFLEEDDKENTDSQKQSEDDKKNTSSQKQQADDKKNTSSQKQQADDKKNTSSQKQQADDKKNTSSQKQQVDDKENSSSRKQQKDNEDNASSQRKKSSLRKVYKISPSSIKVRPLTEAKDLFGKKLYESAISKFQQYRDNNPKGSYYPEATYYIGKSFKNLKMPIEADIFFKEIISSYPESLWASRAKKFLEE